MGKFIQVRDVPEDIHRTLKARAARLGISLSDYLRAELALIAARPTPGEVRERLRRLPQLNVPARERPATIIRRMRDAAD